MIPQYNIIEWSNFVPWRTNEQIEQDLIISRMLVELFSDDFLKEHLAFRGGTALHKLYLNPAPRYSEDIDLVQVIPGPIKPVMQRIREVITFFEEDRKTKIGGHGAKAFYHFTSEFEQVPLKIKVEINCKEHFNVLDWEEFPFEVKSDWFSGKTTIRTYNVNELLGTKLRALYQRPKGRDLFDLYYADQNLELDYDKMIRCYEEYINFSKGKPPTQKQYLLNMEEKEKDPGFAGDIVGLLRGEIEYDQGKAFEWVKENLINRIR